MQVTYNKKLEGKVQKLLTSVAAKESSRYAIQGVKAEVEPHRLIATDGRQLAVVTVSHNLVKGIYEVKSGKIVDSLVDGAFPNWQSIVDNFQGQKEARSRTIDKEESLGLSVMRYCVEHLLVVDLVQHYKEISILDSFGFKDTTVNHIDPKKHEQGCLVIEATDHRSELDVLYLVATREKV